LQPLAPFPAFQARSAEEDAEGEEEDADAEGEEDFGLELDDANTEDPTLYCFCQRVSYGNVGDTLEMSKHRLIEFVYR
jgi:hypothetical protein